MNSEQAPLYTLTIADFQKYIRGIIRQELQVHMHGKESIHEEPLIKITDVCNLLKVSKVTVFDWIKKKILPCHRMGTRLYFKRSEVTAALQTNNRFNIATKPPKHEPRGTRPGK